MICCCSHDIRSLSFCYFATKKFFLHKWKQISHEHFDIYRVLNTTNEYVHIVLITFHSLCQCKTYRYIKQIQPRVTIYVVYLCIICVIKMFSWYFRTEASPSIGVLLLQTLITENGWQKLVIDDISDIVFYLQKTLLIKHIGKLIFMYL